MEEKVKVKSLVSHRVVLNVPDLRLRRVWERKNATVLIPYEQLEEAMYSPGVEGLFVDGVLGIDDMNVKIRLGLEPDGATAPVNIIILSEQEMQRYLTVLPMHEFREKIRELPHQQILEMANYAISHEIANFEKSELIKKYVDVDIISAIKLNRDDKATQED